MAVARTLFDEVSPLELDRPQGDKFVRPEASEIDVKDVKPEGQQRERRRRDPAGRATILGGASALERRGGTQGKFPNGACGGRDGRERVG